MKAEILNLIYEFCITSLAIHSFIKYSLDTYYISAIILGADALAMDRVDGVPPPPRNDP